MPLVADVSDTDQRRTTNEELSMKAGIYLFVVERGSRDATEGVFVRQRGCLGVMRNTHFDVYDKTMIQSHWSLKSLHVYNIQSEDYWARNCKHAGYSVFGVPKCIVLVALRVWRRCRGGLLRGPL